MCTVNPFDCNKTRKPILQISLGSGIQIVNVTPVKNAVQQRDQFSEQK